MKTKTDAMQANATAMTERFGDPGDFAPNLDGAVAAERMEAFLAVREELAPNRKELAIMLATLENDDSGWVAKGRTLIRIGPSAIRFMGEMPQALLNQDMGEGEYRYIYTLAYFGFLEKDPGEGSGYVYSLDSDGIEASGGSEDDEDSADRARHIRSRVNSMQIVALTNQLAAYRDSLPVGTIVAAEPWGAALTAELAEMRQESSRFLWQDGLPVQIVDSLEPYRERLEQLYDPLTSVIEMSLSTE